MLAVILAGCSTWYGRAPLPMPGTNGVTAAAPALPPIDTLPPVESETATLALGCFWGPDARFGSLEGVIRTRVGYAGGDTNNPTYRNLGGHTETVQIDFDPGKVTYPELLEVFWKSHDPTAQPWSRQYLSIIFYHGEDQKNAALLSRRQAETQLGREIQTEVIPLTAFYRAEDYHQKYYLQKKPELFSEFAIIYPETGRLTGSTAAARVNGFLGGYGSLKSLQEQIDSFGLSPSGKERLLQIGRQLLPGKNQAA
jgi:methionine-S-sulfoxide reductase